MLRANMAQLPQTAEDRRVSAPVVTVEASKQFTACRGAQGKMSQRLLLNLKIEQKPPLRHAYHLNTHPT